MERDRNLEIKVGFFVMMGLSLLVVTVVILGSEQNLFERNYTLHGSFSDISGLREGASVRLAGMDVGLVATIEFPLDLDKKEVHVHMRVAERFRDRIRGDTLATIQTQGVLGDKYIALDLGSADRAALEDGSWLETRDPQDLLAGIDDIKQNILEITEKINIMLGSESGQDAGASIRGILTSFKNVAAEIERGDGIVHELIYDKKAGRDMKRMVANISTVMASINGLVGDIKEGDGVLFYHSSTDPLAIVGTAEVVRGDTPTTPRGIRPRITPTRRARPPRRSGTWSTSKPASGFPNRSRLLACARSRGSPPCSCSSEA